MQSPKGIVVIFGSGETSETGKAIYRHVFMRQPRNQNVAILETPAGFQPNSRSVAQKIANVFQTTLSEFVQNVAIVPARKKGTDFSPDNISLLTPLSRASFLFLGPGSPTYTVKQLRDSQAFTLLKRMWIEGATLCLSSAAALAMGAYTLPVYEIYKAGIDPYWENGLNLFDCVGLPMVIVTHWNNTEGGQELDTRFCFMGKERFDSLESLLPKDVLIMGIEEQTAVILDFTRKTFTIDGRGKMSVRTGKTERMYEKNNTYELALLRPS